MYTEKRRRTGETSTAKIAPAGTVRVDTTGFLIIRHFCYSHEHTFLGIRGSIVGCRADRFVGGRYYE